MVRSTGILCPSSRHEGQKACAGADGVVSSPPVYSVDHTAILERKEATRTHPQPGTSPDFRGWVSNNNTYLTIYAQSEDDNEMGCIEIPSNLGMNAGIGGIFDNFSSDKGNCGTVTFNGGRISFTQGESGSINERKAAGIGGAYNGSGGKITVNGGIIEGIKRYEGACIGGGWNGTGNIFTMNGGVIRNLSSEYGAAIGGGKRHNNGGYGGTITINGGTLTSISSADGACIGGGSGGKGGNITINGGVITLATNSQIADIDGAGIGGGDGGAGGTITINGGTINMIQNQNKAGWTVRRSTDTKIRDWLGISQDDAVLLRVFPGARPFLRAERFSVAA